MIIAIVIDGKYTGTRGTGIEASKQRKWYHSTQLPEESDPDSSDSAESSKSEIIWTSRSVVSALDERGKISEAMVGGSD